MENGNKTLQTFLQVAALVLAAGWFYVQLQEWKAHGHDYLGVVLNTVVTLSLWTVLIVLSVRASRSGRRSANSHKSQSLAFRILVKECQFLLKAYREISSADPEHTKWPLSHVDSWPLPNPPVVWNYTELTLRQLYHSYVWLTREVTSAFQEMGWNELLPDLTKNRPYMAEVLAELEKFERTLEAKIAALEAH